MLGQKIHELRLARGLTLLEVAEAVGYEDYRYFSRVFKKQKGITPSEYKKEP